LFEGSCDLRAEKGVDVARGVALEGSASFGIGELLIAS
jgi:hypothetical protein